MTPPYRIQRSRKKGWRAPENAVNCDRNSIFGNPWKIKSSGAVLVTQFSEVRIEAPMTTVDAVNAFSWFLTRAKCPPEWWPQSFTEMGNRVTKGYLAGRRTVILAAIPSLTGKALMCWCAPDQPCHCDVLIEVWNDMNKGAK